MIIQGDCIKVMQTFPEKSFNCCVTSPPYWGLRDYGHDGQIGLESSMEEFVSKMVDVFREVKRCLKDDGTLWLNLGDSYAASGKDRSVEQSVRKTTLRGSLASQMQALKSIPKTGNNLKPKDLCGIPWRVAFALQADGWYLRSDIIWSKPNPMPESVTDRPTKAHEYIFLLSKNPKYYYDADAIREKSIYQEADTYPAGWATGSDHSAISHNTEENRMRNDEPKGSFEGKHGSEAFRAIREYKNKRSVWEIPTFGFAEAHFATFPPDLIEPCILAGCPREGMVLDPFIGSGTTGLVAVRNRRNFTGIELNPKYVELAKARIQRENTTPTMFDL